MSFVRKIFGRGGSGGGGGGSGSAAAAGGSADTGGVGVTDAPRTAQSRRLVSGVTCAGASSEKGEDDFCDLALSDNIDETWHSGKKAPGWIDIDLGLERDVDYLKLLPYQVPTIGDTAHEVYVSKERETWELASQVTLITRPQCVMLQPLYVLLTAAISCNGLLMQSLLQPQVLLTSML